MAEPAPSLSLVALNKIADQLNEREPSLTKEQCFTKVYADPRNRALVAAERAENRPGSEAPLAKGTNVCDRIAALAAALASQHPDMTHDAAVKAVLDRNPALADAYRQECGEAA